MLNKIFVGVRRDGIFEVYRSVYSPATKKYTSVVQVEIHNIFDPEVRSCTYQVRGKFELNESLWNFVDEWMKDHILCDPQEISLASGVYFIKNPRNVTIDSGCVAIACGDGTLIANNSFQIVVYDNITVFKKTPCRIDAWDKTEIKNLF